MKRLTLCITVLVTTLNAVAVGASDSVLLRNVSLINPANAAELLAVNILIIDGKLDVITEDQIALESADIALDARSGVVLGHLSLGEPANFMVLDGDPSQNVDILLDTRTHGIFAIRQGEIVRNRLATVTSETDANARAKEDGWLAYSPPPLAVPLDYQDTGKFNRFDTSPMSGILMVGLLIDRAFWVNQDADSRQQVGDLKDFEAGEIRGLRFGGVGTINFDRPWVWTLFGATHAYDKGYDARDSDDFSWFDVRLDIPTWGKSSVSIGRQKEPISMERLMGMAYLPLQERSAPADAMLPSRNIGVVMSSPVFNDRVVLAGGAFNNWLDKDQPDSFSDNAVNYVGRATWVPFEDDSKSSLLHLGLGYRYSDAKEGGRLRTKPEVNRAPFFVDTGQMEADRLDTYQAEASWRSGRLWVHGEWIRTEIDSEELLDPTVEGFHVNAAWTLTGEMREYNKRVGVFRPLPVARSVYQNGWGAWEVAARYSSLDANDGLLEGGDMDIWSAGINWWLSPYFNVNVDYRYITLDRDGVRGNSQAINTRFVLALE